jgi:ribosomal protein S18 acetylase RimI-like enzyme
LNGIEFPPGFHIQLLERGHPRRRFDCGEQPVTDWLRTKALQHQKKHLSVTKVLLAPDGEVAGYYTLATGQIDFSDLPADVVRRLPRRALPVPVLAWLGVSIAHRRQGLGTRLLSQALRDCHEAGQTFAFVSVILDCINDAAKAFYQQWDFAELPGHPYRLFLSAKQLERMMTGT